MVRGASIMCICEYYINLSIAILPLITAFCLQQQQQKVLYVQTWVIGRICVYSKYTEKIAYEEHDAQKKRTRLQEEHNSLILSATAQLRLWYG